MWIVAFLPKLHDLVYVLCYFLFVLFLFVLLGGGDYDKSILYGKQNVI